MSKKEIEEMEAKEHECCCHEHEECCCNGETTSNEHECHCQKDSDEALRLKALITDLDNKVKYHQAELINYRKRKDEEVSNLLKYANQELIMELIPILDNFERAMKLSNTEDEKQVKFLEGFRILYNHLADTLKKFGVEEIEALGQKFDPNLHDALLVDKDKTQEDEIVLEVLLKGYTLKGRMIRPASVKVNKLK